MFRYVHAYIIVLVNVELWEITKSNLDSCTQLSSQSGLPTPIGIIFDISALFALEMCMNLIMFFGMDQGQI